MVRGLQEPQALQAQGRRLWGRRSERRSRDRRSEHGGGGVSELEGGRERWEALALRWGKVSKRGGARMTKGPDLTQRQRTQKPSVGDGVKARVGRLGKSGGTGSRGHSLRCAALQSIGAGGRQVPYSGVAGVGGDLDSGPGQGGPGGAANPGWGVTWATCASGTPRRRANSFRCWRPVSSSKMASD